MLLGCPVAGVSAEVAGHLFNSCNRVPDACCKAKAKGGRQISKSKNGPETDRPPSSVTLKYIYIYICY